MTAADQHEVDRARRWGWLNTHAGFKTGSTAAKAPGRPEYRRQTGPEAMCAGALDAGDALRRNRHLPSALSRVRQIPFYRDLFAELERLPCGLPRGYDDMPRIRGSSAQ